MATLAADRAVVENVSTDLTTPTAVIKVLEISKKKSITINQDSVVASCQQ